VLRRLASHATPRITRFPTTRQVVTLAPPKGGSNRPFQLQLCNADARNPKAEPEVHTLAFEAHDTAMHWRTLLTERVEQMELEIVREMRVAAAWCMDVYEPRKLWLPSRREEHAEEVAESETPLALKVVLVEVRPGAQRGAGQQQVEARPSPRARILPQAGPGTRARQEFERAAVRDPRLTKVRPLLAAFFAIKGAVLWKITKGGAGEGHPRFFRLFPSDSMLQWDSAEPLVLLGARPGFSAAAQHQVRPSAALAGRAFRFIFAGAEVDVVARSVAERNLWLLAVQSLPIGAGYLGKVEIVSKFDVCAGTGCEGTAISRRRA
jgi:hypothetical protein